MNELLLRKVAINRYYILNLNEGPNKKTGWGVYNDGTKSLEEILSELEGFPNELINIFLTKIIVFPEIIFLCSTY